MNPLRLLLICTLVCGALAARDKQIKLEDIERDNLQPDRKPEAPQSFQHAPPRPPTPAPKMQYGFVPIKTPESYLQQQQYQQDYQLFAQTYQQDPPAVQYQKQVEPQKFVQQVQYVQPEYVPQYVNPSVQYSSEAFASKPQPQAPQYVNPSVQYSSEAFASKPQQQLQYVQQYPGIQYVVDNQLQQSQSQKFLEVPQYYYVQPNQAASTSIQSVSDNKGNVQYVMYLPSGGQGYESLLQSFQQSYPEYTVQPQQQQPVKYTQVQFQTEKPRYTKVQLPAQSKQPKSLLDSYVPSVLQYQYYKQQQENLNAIRQSQKGKGEAGKGYRQHARAYVPQNVKA